MAFRKVQTVCLLQTTHSLCYDLIRSCKVLPICQKKPANKMAQVMWC